MIIICPVATKNRVDLVWGPRRGSRVHHLEFHGYRKSKDEGKREDHKNRGKISFLCAVSVTMENPLSLRPNPIVLNVWSRHASTI